MITEELFNRLLPVAKKMIDDHITAHPEDKDDIIENYNELVYGLIIKGCEDFILYGTGKHQPLGILNAR